MRTSWESTVGLIQQALASVPTGGPVEAVHDALSLGLPLACGVVGELHHLEGAVSLPVRMPAELFDRWLTAPPEHWRWMLTPVLEAADGALLADTQIIRGEKREKLDLLRNMRQAGFGETAGFRLATGERPQAGISFMTFALHEGARFLPEHHLLLRLVRGDVESALARLKLPIIPARPLAFQILEEQECGYICTSTRGEIVEVNRRAYTLVLRYAMAARIPPARCLLRDFVDKALSSERRARPWQLVDARTGDSLLARTHRLAKESHTLGEDILLIVLQEYATAPTRVPPLTWGALTPRQREIALLLTTTGMSCKQIADRLRIREGTLRKHVENIYRATGVQSRAELMSLSIEPGKRDYR